jgi:hypothetical protein
MKPTNRYPFSIAAIYFITAIFIVVILSFENYNKPQRVIEHDVHHYYGYLPAVFIYKDIKVEKSSYQVGPQDYLMWQVQLKEGGHSFKMSYGLSVLYSPFFFIAHQTAMLFGYPEDGYSLPYKLWLILSTVFFSFAGLYFTFKVLKEVRFSDRIISITLLLLGLGTNLFCYSTQQAPVSHAYSFALFGIFIYSVIRYRTALQSKYLLLCAVSFAFITLVRASNGVIIVFFLLYGINNLREISTLKIRLKEMVYFSVALAVIWFPQFYYWKIVSGSWIVNPYGEEGFFFDNPKIYKGLFGFRKGWLVYTPVMIFAMAGLVFRKRIAVFQPAILTFLILNIYIILSWWCWWYGGSMGMRPMVDSYALMAIPLAAFTDYVMKGRIFKKILYSVICLFFVWLNIFQTYQYEEGSLDYERMNTRLYFKQFGKLEKIPDFEKYVSHVNTGSALKGER